MTLIVGFTANQKSFIISDLRITKNEDENKHYFDKTLKFIELDKRVGLFLSGDVEFWKKSIPELKKIIDSVTIENISNVNEPFWQKLSELAVKFSFNPSGAISFIIDKDSKRHFLVKIEIFPGEGAIVTPFEEGKTVIIGSGTNIPELNKKLDSLYEKAKDFYNDSTYQIASFFRFEIKNQIKELGSSTYKKLGISPVMILSILENDYFCICGEEEEGGSYSTNSIYTYKYEFGKSNNGKMVLKNIKEGVDFKVLTIHDLSTLNTEDEIFDPEKVTEQYDPSEHFDGDYIFMLHQTKFPEINLENFSISEKKFWGNKIIRQLYRIDFTTKFRFCKKTLIYTKIIENLTIDEFNKYHQTTDAYFAIPQEIEENFSENKLFDHKLLSSFIGGYVNKLYSGI